MNCSCAGLNPNCSKCLGSGIVKRKIGFRSLPPKIDFESSCLEPLKTPKRFACPYCNSRFKAVEYLWGHLKNHHSDKEITSSEEIRNFMKSNKVVFCENCRSLIKTKSYKNTSLGITNMQFFIKHTIYLILN